MIWEKELETVDLLLKSYGYKAKDMELGVRAYTNSFSNHITIIKGEYHNKEIWHAYKELPPVHESKYIGSTISELKEYVSKT